MNKIFLYHQFIHRNQHWFQTHFIWRETTRVFALGLVLTAGFTACSNSKPNKDTAPPPAAASPENSGKPRVQPIQATPKTKDTPDAATTPDAGPAIASPSVASAGFDPLPKAERALFWGSAEDEPPEKLLASRVTLEGRHYLYSDEENPDNFYKPLQNLGGGYMGVGTDQGYLFIGWMKPQLAWLTDYDQWVVLLHKAHFAFFETAKTPAEYVMFWDISKKKEVLALIEKKYRDDPLKDHVAEVYTKGRASVVARLRRLRAHLNKKGIPGFVNDQEQYEFVRNFIASGRVRPMLGNLLSNTGLIEAGKVAKQLGVPIRALYLSNAEDYWSYPDQFRENIYALHFDEKSLVMRTTASKPKNKDYCYNTQPALNYIEWLKQPYVRRSKDIWRHGRIESETHAPYEHFDKPPEDRKK